MKRLKNLILVVLVFFVGLGFTACKNDNSGNGGNQNQQKHSYTITYQDTKGLTNENPTIYTEDTETIILKDLEDTDDYEFLGWYNGESKVTEITKGSKGNLTLTAKWKEIIRELAYKLSEDGTYYIVTGMGECNISDIVIPDTYNGLPVKEIGNNAFENNMIITSVDIGSINTIGIYAFKNCSLLKDISIKSKNYNFINIKSGAFSLCGKIKINCKTLNLSFLDHLEENIELEIDNKCTRVQIQAFNNQKDDMNYIFVGREIKIYEKRNNTFELLENRMNEYKHISDTPYALKIYGENSFISIYFKSCFYY